MAELIGAAGGQRGFLGCIRSLKMNGVTLDLEERAKVTPGVKPGCSGHCTSYGMYCKNGGKCVEKYNGYSCDCTSTAYDGAFCTKAPSLLWKDKTHRVNDSERDGTQIKRHRALGKEDSISQSHQSPRAFPLCPVDGEGERDDVGGFFEAGTLVRYNFMPESASAAAKEGKGVSQSLAIEANLTQEELAFSFSTSHTPSILVYVSSKTQDYLAVVLRSNAWGGGLGVNVLGTQIRNMVFVHLDVVEIYMELEEVEGNQVSASLMLGVERCQSQRRVRCGVTCVPAWAFSASAAWAFLPERRRSPDTQPRSPSHSLCLSCTGTLQIRYDLGGLREPFTIDADQRNLANGQPHSVNISRVQRSIQLQSCRGKWGPCEYQWLRAAGVVGVSVSISGSELQGGNWGLSEYQWLRAAGVNGAPVSISGSELQGGNWGLSEYQWLRAAGVIGVSVSISGSELQGGNWGLSEYQWLRAAGVIGVGNWGVSEYQWFRAAGVNGAPVSISGSELQGGNWGVSEYQWLRAAGVIGVSVSISGSELQGAAGVIGVSVSISGSELQGGNWGLSEYQWLRAAGVIGAPGKWGPCKYQWLRAAGVIVVLVSISDSKLQGGNWGLSEYQWLRAAGVIGVGNWGLSEYQWLRAAGVIRVSVSISGSELQGGNWGLSEYQWLRAAGVNGVPLSISGSELQGGNWGLSEYQWLRAAGVIGVSVSISGSELQGGNWGLSEYQWLRAAGVIGVSVSISGSELQGGNWGLSEYQWLRAAGVIGVSVSISGSELQGASGVIGVSVSISGSELQG
ncbi:hypothetical protein JZ751_003913 [Albula glossodonta]|uniref:EGF-like domain-containing protein n=1 Tax=Albula glossodonta TaxID=121402 RepID=A0A8T2P878_9TELE|nr:hypothetical protein JZ751_003913 [Albula glossodonta]